MVNFGSSRMPWFCSSSLFISSRPSVRLSVHTGRSVCRPTKSDLCPLWRWSTSSTEQSFSLLSFPHPFFAPLHVLHPPFHSSVVQCSCLLSFHPLFASISLPFFFFFFHVSYVREIYLNHSLDTAVDSGQSVFTVQT